MLKLRFLVETLVLIRPGVKVAYEDEGEVIICGPEEMIETWRSVDWEKYNYFLVEVYIEPVG